MTAGAARPSPQPSPGGRGSDASLQAGGSLADQGSEPTPSPRLRGEGGGEGLSPAIPRADFDWKPLALLAAVALAGLPLIGSPSTWLTLTMAGLAMGMIVFIIASGLTLVFGLMDVLNFGHGVFIGNYFFACLQLLTYFAQS